MMEENIIKKLKKLTVDHNTDAGRMIEKLVEDDLKKCQTCARGINPLRSPCIPMSEDWGFTVWKCEIFGKQSPVPPSMPNGMSRVLTVIVLQHA
jgi:hypothetical protein